MRHRFAVTMKFNSSQQEADEFLNAIIERGLRAFGHDSGTLPITIEKMRQRTIDLDEVKK